MTVPEPLQQVDRTFVNFRGHKFSYFSGCDYFRLSSHPSVVKALQEGARKFGISVSASRLTTGNHKLYQQLEAKLAGFFGAEAALLTSGGYLTNLTAAQALAGEFSHVLIDERAHPSVSDASRFVEAPVLTFRHRDSRDLERAVRRCGPGAKLLLMTDGMFSHDGSAAPLDEYFQVLPKDAWVFVDDAHGAGVLGETGKGAPELAG
ncbi:MAG TPA: pyridoxal phosphate-dependent aminotransferase family protein, partial [Verrucomicrobiae bacterium]|nr:pyridoxal phosphate-dependent aminotransferase family protein [Verrucomicrobiae bacterium]